jgi:hypothetical protein
MPILPFPSPNGSILRLFQERPLLIVDPFYREIPKRNLAESNPSPLPAPIPFLHQLELECLSTTIPANCKVLVSVIDPHRILVASVGFCKFLGLTKEETLGQPIGFLSGPDTDCSCITISKVIKDVRLDEEPKIIHSLTIYHKNGKAKDVQVVCSPHEPASNGSFTHCCFILASSAVGMRCETRKTIPERSTKNSSLFAYRARHNYITGLEIQESLLGVARHDGSGEDESSGAHDQDK